MKRYRWPLNMYIIHRWCTGGADVDYKITKASAETDEELEQIMNYYDVRGVIAPDVMNDDKAHTKDEFYRRLESLGDLGLWAGWGTYDREKFTNR